MNTILQNAEHDLDLLAVYTRDSESKLSNAFKVEFAVFDESAGLPGVQVLPAAGRTEATNDAVGHFAIGCYGAVDGAAAWAPANTITRGRIDWYVTLEAGDAEVLVQRFFEVLPASAARRECRGLALVQDVRDAGAAAAKTDRQIHELLVRTRDLFHYYCRQRFVAVRETRMFRGNGTRMLHLDEPLFGLGSLVEESTTIDNTALRNYGGRMDRHNPKLEIVDDTESIFAVTSSLVFSNRFREYVTGVWGFVNKDVLAPPEEVHQAAIRFAVRVLAEGNEAAGGGAVAGAQRIKRERTDGHEVEYVANAESTTPPSLAALLRDRAIIESLRMFRSMPAMTVAG